MGKSFRLGYRNKTSFPELITDNDKDRLKEKIKGVCRLNQGEQEAWDQAIDNVVENLWKEINEKKIATIATEGNAIPSDAMSGTETTKKTTVKPFNIESDRNKKKNDSSAASTAVEPRHRS